MKTNPLKRVHLSLSAAMLTLFASCSFAQTPIQQGDTAHPITYLLVQPSGHIAGLTGGIVTLAISKNGGAFASPTGTNSEIGNGLYAYQPSSTDDATLGALDIYAIAFLVNPTSAPTTTTASGGGSIAAATYYTAYTFTAQGGETAISPTAQVTTTGSSSTVTVTAPSLPTNSTGINAYIGSTSGNMTRAATATTNAVTFTVLPSGTVSAPAVNTATTSDPQNIHTTIVPWNPFSASNLGLTALPTSAPGAAGGLPTVNGSNQVAVSNFPATVSLSSGDETAIGALAGNFTGLPAAFWGYGSGRTITGGTITTYTGNTPQTGDPYLLATTGTGVKIATGQSTAASNLPTDYQQRGVAVTLPANAPSTFLVNDTTAIGLGTTTSGINTLLGGLTQGSGGTLKFTANALSLAPSGGGGGSDPWATALPGSYTSGQAGYIVGHNLDAPVSGIPAALFAFAFITIPASHTTTGVSETLTYKQWQAVLGAVPVSDNASTAPVASGTSTTSYYLAGQPPGAGTLVYTSTNGYDANTKQVSRTVSIVQPFPTIN